MIQGLPELPRRKNGQQEEDTIERSAYTPFRIIKGSVGINHVRFELEILRGQLKSMPDLTGLDRIDKQLTDGFINRADKVTRLSGRLSRELWEREIGKEPELFKGREIRLSFTDESFLDFEQELIKQLKENKVGK